MFLSLISMQHENNNEREKDLLVMGQQKQTFISIFFHFVCCSTVQLLLRVLVKGITSINLSLIDARYSTNEKELNVESNREKIVLVHGRQLLIGHPTSNYFVAIIL